MAGPKLSTECIPCGICLFIWAIWGRDVVSDGGGDGATQPQNTKTGVLGGPQANLRNHQSPTRADPDRVHPLATP
eukprot:4134244-Pyramimonas_sp.AAC.1